MPGPVSVEDGEILESDPHISTQVIEISSDSEQGHDKSPSLHFGTPDIDLETPLLDPPPSSLNSTFEMPNSTFANGGDGMTANGARGRDGGWNPDLGGAWHNHPRDKWREDMYPTGNHPWRRDDHIPSYAEPPTFPAYGNPMEPRFSNHMQIPPPRPLGIPVSTPIPMPSQRDMHMPVSTAIHRGGDLSIRLSREMAMSSEMPHIYVPSNLHPTLPNPPPGNIPMPNNLNRTISMPMPDHLSPRIAAPMPPPQPALSMDFSPHHGPIGGRPMDMSPDVSHVGGGMPSYGGGFIDNGNGLVMLHTYPHARREEGLGASYPGVPSAINGPAVLSNPMRSMHNDAAFEGDTEKYGPFPGSMAMADRYAHSQVGPFIPFPHRPNPSIVNAIGGPPQQIENSDVVRREGDEHQRRLLVQQPNEEHQHHVFDTDEEHHPSFVRGDEDELSEESASVEHRNEGQAQPPSLSLGKKPSRPDLKELRKRALLSMLSKAKNIKSEKNSRPMEVGTANQPGAQESMLSTVNECMSRPAASAVNNALSSTDNCASHRVPVGNRVSKLVVELSDTELHSDFASDNSEVSTDDNTDAEHTETSKGEKSKAMQRAEAIESMRIRSAQLGKCPSSLLVKKQSRSRPAAIQSLTTSEFALEKTSTELQPEGSLSVRKDLDCRQETNENKVIPGLESPTDIAVKPSAAVQPKEDSILRSGSPKASKSTRFSSEIVKQGELHVDLVGSPRAPVAKHALKARPEQIELLKKKIAILEARNASKGKLTANDSTTNSNSFVTSLRTGNTVMSKGVVAPRVPGMRGTKKEEGKKVAKSAQTESWRYYAGKVINKRSEQNTVATKESSPEKPKIPEEGPKATEQAKEQSVWNQRNGAERVPVDAVDRCDAGLVNDLKSELETQKRNLASFQDYSKLVNASDVSLAEAAAKVTFKRARLAALEKDLKNAEFSVIDAEQDYENIAHAAKRLRKTLDDRGISDMFQMPDIPTKLSGEKQPSSIGDNDSTKNGSAKGRNRASTDARDDFDIDTYNAKTVGDDFILRKSPYSPATDDNFLSCLSALQSYILRIPHHNKAADRRSVSPLSLTWTHNLDPMKAICPRELRRSRSCMDRKCQFEHLRDFPSRTGHALGVVDRVQTFIGQANATTEKQIVRAKIDLYEGKNVDETVSSLISSLYPVPNTAPISRS